jgi:hypothetical protein
MNLRWRRLAGAALAAEALPIVFLVITVVIFSSGDPVQDEIFAASTGRWFGPVVGALVTFLVGIWVARGVSADPIAHGFALGVLVAGLDLAIIAASPTPFEWLFFWSALGRVAAGTLGGVLAARSTPEHRSTQQ